MLNKYTFRIICSALLVIFIYCGYNIFAIYTYKQEKKLAEIIAFGTIDEIQILLDKGLDPNKQFIYLDVPLLAYATANQNADVTRLFINAGAEVNACNSDDSTIFLLSVTDANIENLEVLIASGAEVHKKNKNGVNALIQAAASRDSVEFVEFIYNLGFNIEDRTYTHNSTALIEAVQSNPSLEVFDFLYKKGADINAKGIYDFTVLMNSLENSNLDIMKKIINLGAKICLEDDTQPTVFEYAKFLDNEDGTTIYKTLVEASLKKYGSIPCLPE